jgi:hypothetical protein
MSTNSDDKLARASRATLDPSIECLRIDNAVNICFGVAMSQKSGGAIVVIGIDIGKNSFHVVGHDARGAIVLRQKWSPGRVEGSRPR